MAKRVMTRLEMLGNDSLLQRRGIPYGVFPGHFHRLPFVIDRDKELFVGSLDQEHVDLPVWSDGRDQGQINFARTNDGWKGQIHMTTYQDRNTPEIYSELEKIRDEWLRVNNAS